MQPKTIKQPKNKFIKLILLTLGLLSLGLGILGIFLPILPTTPFLLLSAALFLKSSTRLYNWLMNHKFLGKHLENYLHHKTIPRKTKIIAVSLLWVTILFSLYILDNFFVKLLLITIAIGVTMHLLSFKSNFEK